MPTEIQDIRLVIKIDNKQPVELIDLTKSLISLASQFDKYSSKFGGSKESQEAKLYVKEIKSGSIIVELVELATNGMIPFTESSNTILDFAGHLKSVVDFFTKDKGHKPELSSVDYKEISAIINPIAKDNASKMEVTTTINGGVNLNFYVNSKEASKIQDSCKTEIDNLKLAQHIDGVNERVVLTWYQARSDPKSIQGNKGVIEEISERAMNIIFDSEELKEQMLHNNDINPLNTAFVVDVKIQSIQGVPKIYKVLKLHEYFEID